MNEKKYLSKKELRRLCSEIHHYVKAHRGMSVTNRQDIMNALSKIPPHRVFTDSDYYDDDDVKYTLQALSSIETICVSEREKTGRTNTNLSVGQFNIPISNNCECKNCENNHVEYDLVEEYVIDENGVAGVDYSNQGDLCLALISSEYGFDSVRISDTIQKVYDKQVIKMNTPLDSMRLKYLDSINPPHAADIKILYTLSQMGNHVNIDHVDINNFRSSMVDLTKDKSIAEMADYVSSLPEEELIRYINASEYIPADYDKIFGSHRALAFNSINERRSAEDERSLYDKVDLLGMSGRDCMFTVALMCNGKFEQEYSKAESKKIEEQRKTQSENTLVHGPEDTPETQVQPETP